MLEGSREDRGEADSMKFFKHVARYRNDQVSSSEKISILWRNISEALGLEVGDRRLAPVKVDVQYALYEPYADVTFSAYVRKG